MKATLTISLDTDLIEKLRKENNYSDLINKEMKAYYDVETIKNLKDLKKKQVEIKGILKENRKKLRDIDVNIEIIDKKERLFKRKLLSRDKMIIEIIKKRKEANKHSFRQTKFFETPEEEADRILKGGKKT